MRGERVTRVEGYRQDAVKMDADAAERLAKAEIALGAARREGSGERAKARAEAQTREAAVLAEANAEAQKTLAAARTRLDATLAAERAKLETADARGRRDGGAPDPRAARRRCERRSALGSASARGNHPALGAGGLLSAAALAASVGYARADE